MQGPLRLEIPEIRTQGSNFSVMPTQDHFAEATSAVRSRMLVVGLVGAAFVGLVAVLLWGFAVGIVVLVVGAGAWYLWTRSLFGGAVDRMVGSSSSAFVEGGSTVEALVNAVEGVGVMTGVSLPDVRLISSDAANALATSSGDQSALVVTSALIKESGPAELESVSAELLCRLRDGSAEYLTICAAIPGLLKSITGASAAQMASMLGDQRSARADLEALSITRYPPALISTLARMGENGTIVKGAQPVTAPLWLAPAVESASGRDPLLDTAIQPVSYRMALLSEL